MVFVGPSLAGAAPSAIPAEKAPVGIYLWFPIPGGPNSEQDCRDLVDRIQPSKKKAEMSFWGAIPEGDRIEEAFYLFVSENRMEPSYAAEGDYDFGTVTFGATRNGTTPFRLIPDEHPDVTIDGTIVAKPDSEIVTVTLRSIPLNGGYADRTTFYCRFDELGTRT